MVPSRSVLQARARISGSPPWRSRPHVFDIQPPHRPLAMPANPNASSQGVRRSTRQKRATAQEPTPDSLELSGSATPTWSGVLSPSHPNESGPHAGPAAPESVEDQPEEDSFMPTTQEVAETLAGMRSRRQRDEGVSATLPGRQSLILNLNCRNQALGNHRQWGWKVRFTHFTCCDELIIPVTKPVSPLFAFPTGGNLLSESWLSENVSWPTFIKVASTEMRLQEGFTPDLAWKFSNGPGSKMWIALSDERSYRRMMEAGAKRIRNRAKKESNLKEPNYGSGWRIDIKILNYVPRLLSEIGADATGSQTTS